MYAALFVDPSSMHPNVPLLLAVYGGDSLNLAPSSALEPFSARLNMPFHTHCTDGFHLVLSHSPHEDD